MDSMKQISARIKDLREFSDFSEETLATLAGIPVQEYIEYEQGIKDIPIGALYDIAAALQIDPSVILFAKNATTASATAVYKGRGTSVERYNGYSFVSLNNEFIGKNMEPMLVTIKQDVAPELVRHKGQEFNYVIKGSLRVIVGEKEFYLRAGDSLYFDASIPHAQVAMEKVAKFITVIEKE